MLFSPRHRDACVAVLVTLLALTGCAGAPAWNFDVAADMRGYTPPEYPGPAYFAGACEAIRDLGPGAFMLSPGDFDPPARTRATIDDVLGKDYIWYPVIGNHEFDAEDHLPWLRAGNEGGRKLPYIVRSGPPGAVETCYSFDYKNAHFVVLNEYYDGLRDVATDGCITEALLGWLRDDLEANTKPLIFVAGHEPVVSMPDIDNWRVRHQGDSLDKYPAQTLAFWRLLREHRVLAYFCGHTHDASICKINGIWQIDAGHARGMGDPGAPSTFMKVYVEGGRVRCDVYRADAEGLNYRLTFSESLR